MGVKLTSTRYDPTTTKYGKGELRRKRPPSGVQRCPFRLPPSWISMKTDVIFPIHIHKPITRRNFWDVSESPRASERVWGSPWAPKIESSCNN